MAIPLRVLLLEDNPSEASRPFAASHSASIALAATANRLTAAHIVAARIN
jgi:hypothetical protein